MAHVLGRDILAPAADHPSAVRHPVRFRHGRDRGIPDYGWHGPDEKYLHLDGLYVRDRLRRRQAIPGGSRRDRLARGAVHADRGRGHVLRLPITRLISKYWSRSSFDV